jgi:hypothetical protein
MKDSKDTDNIDIMEWAKKNHLDWNNETYAGMDEKEALYCSLADKYLFEKLYSNHFHEQKDPSWKHGFPEIPMEEDYCLFANISINDKDILDKKYSSFAGRMEKIRLHQGVLLVKFGMSKKFKDTIVNSILKTKHGYTTDTSEVKEGIADFFADIFAKEN